MDTPEELQKKETQDFEENMRNLRRCGRVPLGILSYDVENEEFTITRFANTSLEDLDALLRTVGFHAGQPRKKK